VPSEFRLRRPFMKYSMYPEDRVKFPTRYPLEESAGALSARCREICPSQTPALCGALRGERSAFRARIEIRENSPEFS